MVLIFHATDAATASIIARDGVKSPKSRGMALDDVIEAVKSKGWGYDSEGVWNMAWNCWSGSFFTTRTFNPHFGSVVIAVDTSSIPEDAFTTDDFGFMWDEVTRCRIEAHSREGPKPHEWRNGREVKVTADIPPEAVRILTPSEVAKLEPWNRPSKDVKRWREVTD
mgnify:FL=1|jgi:hypothetical protein